MIVLERCILRLPKGAADNSWPWRSLASALKRGSCLAPKKVGSNVKY